MTLAPRPRCLGQTYERHDPRPMHNIDGTDVWRCPACDNRIELPPLAPEA